MALLLALANARHRPSGAIQIGLDGRRLDAGLEVDLLTLALHQTRGKRRLATLASSELGLQRPVLDRDERLDLPLTIDDHAHGHRLDAPGRQTAPNLASQERADRIADQTIDDAPRLLSIYSVHVDAARVLQRVEHGAAGDLVEFDATDRLIAVEPESRDQMPGDRLAFAIGVSRQQHRRLAAGLVLQPFDDVFAFLGHHILGPELVVDVDAQPTGGQIADMPQAGPHSVLASQEFLDGFCLGGRFDHDQALFGHCWGVALVLGGGSLTYRSAFRVPGSA